MTEASEVAKAIHKELLKQDPDCFGDISVDRDFTGAYVVNGFLKTKIKNLEKVIKESAPNIEIDLSENFNSELGLKVKSTFDDKKNQKITRVDDSGPLHKIEILKYDTAAPGELDSEVKFKKLNKEMLEHDNRIFTWTEFLTPIIVDKDYKVIDGVLRKEIALRNKLKSVPIIILNTEGEISDFLRIVLNRSSEFQRWNYDELDSWIDNQVSPELLTLLEPLGVFGNKYVPKTYFGSTMSSYVISEDNTQQAAYLQSEGLEDWAIIARALKEEQAKKNDKLSAKPDNKDIRSLFDFDGDDE